MASWSDIPDELLDIIIKKLVRHPYEHLINDLLQCRDVSEQWRRVVDYLLRDKQMQNQLKLVPLQYLGGKFLNNFAWKYKEIKLPRLINTDFATKIVYTAHGWLLLSAHSSMSMCLFHPLLNTKIELPPLNPSWKQIKFTVSSKASTILVLLDGKELLFLRQGDHEWSPVDTEGKSLYNLICYNDEFYAVDLDVNLLRINISGPNPHAYNVLRWIQWDYVIKPRPEKFIVFLAESSCGDLLVVLGDKMFIHGCYETAKFDVYKMNWKEMEWIYVEFLGEDSLFLGGESEALCVCVPNGRECQKGHIYFTINDSDFGERDYDRTGRRGCLFKDFVWCNFWYRTEI